MIAAAAMATLLLMVVLLAPPAAAGAEPAYKISFDNSVEYLSTGQTGKVMVTVGPGSPEGSYNYTVSADQGSVTPTSGTTSASTFNITASAPTASGKMVVMVTLSDGKGDSTAAKYTIHVVDPVVISATVKNAGPVSLTGVPVQFFVDNNLVNETTFDIDANSTKVVSYSWTTPGLDNGEHSFKVVIDPEGKYPFLSTASGSHEYSSKFYVGDSGWGLANLVLALTLVLLVVILFLTYMGRNKKKK